MSKPQLTLKSAGGSLMKRQFLRRTRSWGTDSDVEVEITPLIDCVFLLLIFFLVTTMMKKLEKQIPVVLPDSTVALAEVAQRSVLVIGLDEKGGFFQGGQEDEGQIITPRTEVPDLAVFLQDVARTRGAATSIRLDADRNAPFQQVVDALDICSLQGFENVGIRIQTNGKEFYELGDRRSLGLPPAARKASP